MGCDPRPRPDTLRTLEKEGQRRSAGRGENLRTYAAPRLFYRQKPAYRLNLRFSLHLFRSIESIGLGGPDTAPWEKILKPDAYSYQERLAER